MNKVILTLIIFCVSPTFGGAPSPIQDLQKILKAEEEVRTKLNSKLFTALKQAVDQPANAKNKSFDEELNTKISDVIDNKNDIIENHLRIDFLNTFINKLDSTSTGDIKKVAVEILINMAHKQLISDSETNSSSQMWLFAIYLAIAVRDIMEPNENFGEFVKKFIIFSSLREPRSPADFLKERDYINP